MARVTIVTTSAIIAVVVIVMIIISVRNRVTEHTGSNSTDSGGSRIDGLHGATIAIVGGHAGGTCDNA